MISSFFYHLFYQPLVNIFVVAVYFIPGNDLGFAIVGMTILVRALLAPFTHKILFTQQKVRELEPHIAKIKEDLKDKKEEQARKIMELYRQHGINPFSGFLMLFIQIPLLLALYWIFSEDFAKIQSDLYSFVLFPVGVNTMFLGILDLTKRSVILAFAAGFTQYIQGWLAVPPQQKEITPPEPSMATMMQTQMRYVFPVMIVIIGLQFSAALSLYWTVMNIFAIIHEWWIRRKSALLSLEFLKK